MKRILFSILLVLILIPFIVNAAECDTSKVYIESIGIENSIGDVVELEEATVKDKVVNINLSMTDKEDEILYKLVLKNDSSEDYEINKNSININSDYIDYSLESDNDNVIKANTTKTIYLRVKYSKEVDSSKLVDGVYQDDITMKVNLKSDNTISNPKTGIPYLIIISIVLIISGITFIINKNNKISTLLILLGVITLPLGVKALCSCEVIVNSKVTIIKKTICITEGIVGDIHLLPFIEDVTWDQYYEMVSDDIKEELDMLWESHMIERKTNFITSKCMLVDKKNGYECYNEAVYKAGPYADEETYEENFYGSREEDDIILDSTKICYTYID